MLWRLHNFLPRYRNTYQHHLISLGECSAHVGSYSQSQIFLWHPLFHQVPVCYTQRHTWSEKLAQGFYTWLGWESNLSLWFKSPGLYLLSHVPQQPPSHRLHHSFINNQCQEGMAKHGMSLKVKQINTNLKAKLSSLINLLFISLLACAGDLNVF